MLGGRSAGAMLVVLVLLNGCLSSTDAPESPGASPSQRPNILVIVTDDQHPDTVVDYMPHVTDRFLSGGTNFSRAYTTIPICCPARAGILTGLFGHNNRVHGNDDGGRIDENVTLQAYLKQAGYRTALFGKLLNTFEITRNPLYLDDYVFGKGTYGAGDPTNPRMNDNGNQRLIEEHTNDLITRRTIDFVRASETNDEQPWFAYVATYSPHAPWFVRPEFQDAPVAPWPSNPAVEEVDLTDKPPYVRANQAIGQTPVPREFWDVFPQDQSFRHDLNVQTNIPIPMPDYLRSIIDADGVVGDVFAALDELGETDDTLAIFTSDHGYALGEHGWWNKEAPYEPIIRVPLAIRWPAGGVTSGATDERLASNVDILPSVLQGAGIIARNDTPPDGHSLLDPTWQRDGVWTEWYSGASSEPVLGWDGNARLPFPGVPPYGSLRAETFHYVEYYNVSEPQVLDAQSRTIIFQEYYDLARDPWELDNLLRNANPSDDPSAATINELSQRVKAAWSCTGTSGQNPCP